MEFEKKLCEKFSKISPTKRDIGAPFGSLKEVLSKIQKKLIDLRIYPGGPY